MKDALIQNRRGFWNLRNDCRALVELNVAFRAWCKGWPSERRKRDTEARVRMRMLGPHRKDKGRRGRVSTHCSRRSHGAP